MVLDRFISFRSMGYNRRPFLISFRIVFHNYLFNLQDKLRICWSGTGGVIDWQFLVYSIVDLCDFIIASIFSRVSERLFEFLKNEMIC